MFWTKKYTIGKIVLDFTLIYVHRDIALKHYIPCNLRAARTLTEIEKATHVYNDKNTITHRTKVIKIQVGDVTVSNELFVQRIFCLICRCKSQAKIVEK